jgi:hypothetical protein
MEINQTLRDGRALQYDEMDQRNRSRMKYIERSSQKTDFSTWRLGDRKVVEEAMKRVPTDEEDPRQASHEPLRLPVPRDKDGEQRITDRQ